MDDGAFIIDKPAGITSHDVVARVRKLADTRRVGHAGTLDPFATGVLIVCIGRATRLVQFLVGLDKEYEATIRLGFATDTQDLTGEQITPLRTSNAVSLEDIRKALAEFEGEQLQTPPMYSAKKVDGERLYRAARAGREVERPAARITVHSLDLLSVSSETESGMRELIVRVNCSSGTYVRTLANDIGERLGTGAHLSALRRTAVGRVRIERAHKLDALEHMTKGDLSTAVLRPSEVVEHLPLMELGEGDVERISHGRPLERCDGELRTGGLVRLCDASGELVAVAEVSAEGVVRPKVVMR